MQEIASGNFFKEALEGSVESWELGLGVFGISGNGVDWGIYK